MDQFGLIFEAEQMRRRIDELERDRDSWRRVAEKLERENADLRRALEARDG